MLNHIKLSSILLFALIIMHHIFLSQSLAILEDDIPLIAQARDAAIEGPESPAEAVEVVPKAEEEVPVSWISGRQSMRWSFLKFLGDLGTISLQEQETG